MRITDLIREATGGDRLGRAGNVQEFATAVGTTSSTVSRWRVGVVPGPQWRQPLAEALELTEEEVEAACGGTPPVTLEELSAKLDRVLDLLARTKVK